MAKKHLSLRAAKELERAAQNLRRLPASSVRQSAARAVRIVQGAGQSAIRQSTLGPGVQLADEIKRLLGRSNKSQWGSILAGVTNPAAGRLVSEVSYYAKLGKTGNLFNAVMGRLGPMGLAVKWLLGSGGSGPGPVSAGTIQNAIDLLEGLGLEVRIPSGGIATPPPLPSRTGSQPPIPTVEPSRPDPAQPVAGGMQTKLPTGTLPGGKGISMEQVQSSNVYAIGYDAKTLTMRVQYLGGTISRSALKGKGHRGKRRVKGQLGRTVTRDRRGPGPTYDYKGVPQGVFTRIQSAGSKGGAIWDNLRIRGTAYGHKYDYELVAASVVDVVLPEVRQLPGGGYGVFAGKKVGRVTYVPRRAVGPGQFKSRRIQQGDRQYRSLLPSQGLAKRDSRG